MVPFIRSSWSHPYVSFFIFTVPLIFVIMIAHLSFSFYIYGSIDFIHHDCILKFWFFYLYGFIDLNICNCILDVHFSLSRLHWFCLLRLRPWVLIFYHIVPLILVITTMFLSFFFCYYSSLIFVIKISSLCFAFTFYSFTHLSRPHSRVLPFIYDISIDFGHSDHIFELYYYSSSFSSYPLILVIMTMSWKNYCHFCFSFCLLTLVMPFHHIFVWDHYH